MKDSNAGAEILLDTNFDQLQAHILETVSHIIKKVSFTLEDKFIIENSMSLWTGCVLYKPELFKDFVSW